MSPHSRNNKFECAGHLLHLRTLHELDPIDKLPEVFTASQEHMRGFTTVANRMYKAEAQYVTLS